MELRASADAISLTGDSEDELARAATSAGRVGRSLRPRLIVRPRTLSRRLHPPQNGLLPRPPQAQLRARRRGAGASPRRPRTAPDDDLAQEQAAGRAPARAGAESGARRARRRRRVAGPVARPARLAAVEVVEGAHRRGGAGEQAAGRPLQPRQHVLHELGAAVPEPHVGPHRLLHGGRVAEGSQRGQLPRLGRRARPRVRRSTQSALAARQKGCPDAVAAGVQADALAAQPDVLRLRPARRPRARRLPPRRPPRGPQPTHDQEAVRPRPRNCAQFGAQFGAILSHA